MFLLIPFEHSPYCSHVISREVFCHEYGKIPSPKVIWNGFWPSCCERSEQQHIPLSESTIFHCFIDFLMTFSPTGYPVYLHFVDPLMTFSPTGYPIFLIPMTSSSLSLPQVITSLTFSIFPLDKYPHGVYIFIKVIIPIWGIYPNNPLTLRKESYLCPIIIVTKIRQIPIFPQTQCLAIPHPINHRSVPAAVWSTQTVQRLTARNLSTAWNVSRDRYGES